MVGSGQYYEDLVNEIYRRIESLNVEDYQLSDSDAWQRSRSPILEGQLLDIAARPHLAFWVNLGPVPTATASRLIHRTVILCTFRWIQEEHARSQGIMHAAIRDVMLSMSRWCWRDVQATPTGAPEILEGPDYFQAAITFDLAVPAPWSPS